MHELSEEISDHNYAAGINKTIYYLGISKRLKIKLLKCLNFR